MTLDDAHDAATLIASALATTRGVDDATRGLVRRYQTDSDFRAVVDSVSRGLGLRVVDVVAGSVLLAAEANSPFAFRVSDYKSGMSVDDRLCHGLIQVAIAAWCFPTAAALEDDERGLLPVTVSDVVEYLVRVCVELEQRATIDEDLARPELREAWRLVAARPQVKQTGTGRRSASTLSGMVAWSLERLAREGLLRADGDDRYRVRAAYRSHVREVAAHEAFQLVSSVPTEVL